MIRNITSALAMAAFLASFALAMSVLQSSF